MSKIKKSETAIVAAPKEKDLALLREMFPQDQGSQKTLFPRITLISKDGTEEVKNPKTGRKEIKVITEAGTFVKETPTDKIDEDTGKKAWEKQELGTSIDVEIIFQRKQLKHYDGTAFTSSPIYDNDEEIIPLFKDKAEIDRATPKELKSRPIYRGQTQAGKPKSTLEDTKILYVIFEGKLYQMNVRGTSMYAFRAYAKSCLVPAVITRLSSEAKENGSVKWQQMTFEIVRDCDATEVSENQKRIMAIQASVKDEKDFYANNIIEGEATDKELDDMVEEAHKALR